MAIEDIIVYAGLLAYVGRLRVEVLRELL